MVVACSILIFMSARFDRRVHEDVTMMASQLTEAGMNPNQVQVIRITLLSIKSSIDSYVHLLAFFLVLYLCPSGCSRWLCKDKDN